jgi:carbon monoxide dehydrogenase subunit G
MNKNIGGEPVKIEYSYTFGLPRKIVWTHIKVAPILKKALKGCKEFEEINSGTYRAMVDINLGPIQDVFELEIVRAKEKSPSSYELMVKGKGKLGEIQGKGNLHFLESQGFTKMNLDAEAELTGSLAVVGKKMLEGSARKGLESFFQHVEKEIKRSLYLQKRGR